MKKLFIALLFSAVLFIGLPSTYVSAMPVTYDIPFSYVPDAADLFLGMLSGGQYDLSNASTLEEAIQQHKESLQQGYHFLQRFATNLWNWQVIQAGLGNTSLNEDSDLAIYVSPSDIAAFMGYNLKWWEREQVTTDIVIVEPPAGTSQSILFAIDVINGSGFDFIKNATVTNVRLRYSDNVVLWDDNTLQPYSNSTFYTYNKNGTDLPWSKSKFSDITTALFVSNNGIDNLYIYYNNNTGKYEVTLTKSNSSNEMVNANYGFYGGYDMSYGVPSSYGSITFNYGVFIDGNNFDGAIYGGSNPWYLNVNWSSLTLSDADLDSLFAKLSRYVRNANIYVDGVLYSQGGVPNIPSDYISAPDVIQVGDTGIESYDVFIPDIPGYGGLSINGFLEWLNTRLGDKDIGLDDLIEDAPDIVIGVDENDQPTIRPITYDDTRPAPIVIDTDTFADPNLDNPTPTPTPDPTTFPLPPFPKFPIPSDIPNANIQHTVLAEIIDATQSVVPKDLMVLIWSTFSLLIIGGIIYILHK